VRQGQYNGPVCTRVFGVLAGADMGSEKLAEWAQSADLILAADAGADLLLTHGIVPHYIVGDMDSLSREARCAPTAMHVRDDQHATDCDKLLALAEELGHRELTLGGVEGDRADHVLATWLSVARSPLKVRLALRWGLGWVLKGANPILVQVEPGQTVSLLPLADCIGATLTGVQWPLHDEMLAWHRTVSISNVARESRIEASIDVGLAALIVEFPPHKLPRWDV